VAWNDDWLKLAGSLLAAGRGLPRILHPIRAAERRPFHSAVQPIEERTVAKSEHGGDTPHFGTVV